MIGPGRLDMRHPRITREMMTRGRIARLGPVGRSTCFGLIFRRIQAPSHRMLIWLAIATIAAGCAGAAAPIAAPASRADTAWRPPARFIKVPQNAAVAYRWLDKGEFTCAYSRGACWGMYVIPRDGCPSSLYVELSLLDSAGNAVGFTNDTAGAVQPGQRAKLVFDSFEDGAVKARLAEVSCY